MLRKHAVTGYSLGQTNLSESSLSVLHTNLSVLCQGQPSIKAVHYFNQLCRDTHIYYKQVRDSERLTGSMQDNKICSPCKF